MTTPVVSFLMCVHNEQLHWVERAVLSQQYQTFSDWESVVVADGVQSESVRKFLRQLADSDSRFRVLFQENRGLTKSLNYGISFCRGEYVARQDADDWSMPRRIETQLDYLLRTPGVAMVGSACVCVSKDGFPVGIPTPVVGVDNVQKYFSKGNPFAHGSVLIRKEALLSVGCYDESLPAAQDYDCFYRVCSSFGGNNLSEPLYVLRYNGGSVSSSRAVVQLKANSLIQRRITGNCGSDAPNESEFGLKGICRLADHLMLGGDRCRAVKILLSAVFQIGPRPFLMGKLVRSVLVFLFPQSLRYFLGFRHCEIDITGALSEKIRVLALIPGIESDAGAMIFAKRQSDALAELGISIKKFFIGSRTELPVIFREWVRLRYAIKSFKPNVIHCHYGTMTAFLAVCATRVPIVVTYRGSDLNPVPSGNRIRTMLGHMLSQISAIFAKRIICVSQELRDSLWWGKGKAVVIPTGVDTRMFKAIPRTEARARLGWSATAPIVLFNAGRSPRVKRLDLAEKAVQIAREASAAIKLVVLNGDILPDEIPFYHSAADVLLLTSDFEGSPTIVQEAIACALPVVSVDVGDVKERMSKVHPAIIVPRDPQIIATALLKILALGERSNGPEIAVSDFDSRVTLLTVIATLKTAIGLQMRKA